MNVVLWIVQVLLAILFLMAGIMKVTQPREKLAEKMAFVEDFSDRTVRTIGILEIMAAVGLVLPVLTGILPMLTPLAAMGLVLTMIGAVVTHVRRAEYKQVVVNLILMAMAAFVAYGWFVEL